MLFVGTSIIHPSTEGVFLLCNILDLLIYSLLLQFLHNTANSSCPHYMIDKKGNKPQMVKHWKDTYNVSLLEYGDDYSCLESSLEELRDLVFELRAERGMP